MEFFDVVAKRRSIRQFKSDSVANETILRVLEAGRWAPSAGNSQPWHFVVVTDAEIRQKIAETCTEFSRKAWKRFPPKRARYLAERGGSWDKSRMAQVPVLIVVCYRILEEIREELVLASVWTSVENILLAATAENLGSCIYTTLDEEEEAKLRDILEAPQKYRIATIIQLGYAESVLVVPKRKKLNEIVSYQHF
jgi:nitroreductase